MHSCCIIIVVVLDRRARPYNGRNVPSPKYPSESLLFWICGKCVHASRVHASASRSKWNERISIVNENDILHSIRLHRPMRWLLCVQTFHMWCRWCVSACVCTRACVLKILYEIICTHSQRQFPWYIRLLFSISFLFGLCLHFFHRCLLYLANSHRSFSCELWLHVCRIQFIPEQFCVCELLSWAAALLATHTNICCCCC